MQTYSFPVVEYGDGSAVGDVWRDVEVRECRVIAKAPKDDGFTTRIQSHWFCETLRFLHQDEYGSTQTPVTLYEQLKGLHINVDWLGSLGNPEKVEVELIFDDDNSISWVDSAAGSALFFSTAYVSDNEQEKENKLNDLLRWAAQYIRIFNAQTIFTTKNEKYADLLKEWNETIEEATKKFNERK